MAGKGGPKLTLTDAKLKILFKTMQKAPTAKYIAYSLGVSKTVTIKNWYQSGSVLLEQFEDQLWELESLVPMDYISIFEQRKPEFETEFKILYNVEEDKPIPDRLWTRYNDYIAEERDKFVEGNLERKEKEILSRITLSEDEETDRNFKLLIRFKRIYDRARCTLEIDLLNSVTRNGKTAKNAPLGFKLLQTYNKEDFGETQTVNHTGTIEVNNNSVISMALAYEKEQRLIKEKKDRQVLDAKELNLIEQKEQE